MIQVNEPLTDQQIKVMVVYKENTDHLSGQDLYRYNAFSALWEEFTSVFIKDTEITVKMPDNG